MSEATELLRSKLAQLVEISEWARTVDDLTPEEDEKFAALALSCALTNARVTTELEDRISALERRRPPASAPARRMFEPPPADMRW